MGLQDLIRGGVVAALIATAVACGAHAATQGSQAPAPSPSAPKAEVTSKDDKCPPAAPGQPVAPPINPAKITKLLVVVLENKNACATVKGMPYLAGLADKYATAARYYAMAHPSLPNYLTLAGGSTFGIRDDRSPAAHKLPGQSVFGQVLAAGEIAKTYAEDMKSNCQLEQGKHDTYAVRHNPWLYFVSDTERQGCQQYDVPAGTPEAGEFHDDVANGTLPTFGFLAPNLCDDAHDCPLDSANTWMKTWFGPLLAGPDFTSGHLLVLVTFDEDDKHAGNRVLMVAVNPSLHHLVVDTRLDHTATSKAVSTLVSAPPLREAANAPDLYTTLGLTH
ncbi:alkaline phosphatase family protein [Kribbella monticola]|uniref:alkaline phosphatase family protein n=1 Tax=Kribbella monticola TaxID=2185285 RepID=UPI000DD3E233|nr:alkaline phosphatase family protein [Kribbella monticola]